MSSTAAAFEAYYLQRATAELADDLVQLRSAADFVVPDDEPADADKSRPSKGISKGSKPGVTAEDNSLQVLIGALRQGTRLFAPADQARVVGHVDT